jgi:hypothetical protein
MNYADLMPKHPRWSRARDAAGVDYMGPDAADLGRWVRKGHDPLRAMLSVDLFDGVGSPHAEAGHWLHLSVSRANRLPSWADLVLVRDEFGFADRVFVQLLPPASAWLNAHSYVLHLFHRLDAATVPRILWDQEGATGEGYRAEGTLLGRRTT